MTIEDALIARMHAMMRVLMILVEVSGIDPETSRPALEEAREIDLEYKAWRDHLT